MSQRNTLPAKRLLMTTVAFLALAACEGFDADLRDIGNGFDTSEAVANLPDRPRPDDRGVISYPTYQVAVARDGDTITTVATRLGLNASELARYNGTDANALLRRDEVVALPGRVSEPSTATGAVRTGPLDVAAVATTALDRAGPQTAVTSSALPSSAQSATPRGTEPVRHQVQAGESVYSVARLYGVPVRNIAEWNGLGPDLSVREGQFLLIPQGNQSAPITASAPVVEAPGAGSNTPVPPSAIRPLPTEAPTTSTTAQPAAPAAPNLGTPAPAASNARMVNPVSGSIIRAYSPGSNEGIDYGVPAGTTVKAADAGTVAAVTTDTAGVAIIVIKHNDSLLTVYTNLEGLSVAKGDTVTRGQSIAKVRAGDPSFLHFEVRRGLQSVDPSEFLP